MNLTWINPNITYYVAKTFGFLPIVERHRFKSLCYLLFLWIFLGSSGVYINMYHYEKTQNVSSKYSIIVKVAFIEVLLKFVVAILSTAYASQKGKGFFDLQDKFYKFDRFTLRIQCPPDPCIQMFYLLYILFMCFYNFTCTMIHTNIVFYVILLWNLFCTSTMLPVVQYSTYVRMLRKRYKLANDLFTNSVMKNISTGVKPMHPKEINSLFIELRGLTEEVKTYYAYHTILHILETVFILISSVTTLTVNYLNDLDTRFIHNGYFMGHCTLRLLFLYCVIRETHNATLEALNTISIGHEALSVIPDDTTTKHLRIIILNSWNHPIIFDVHDFIDLDYKLLQSIVASVVTYVVVLVQIQLAIMDT